MNIKVVTAGVQRMPFHFNPSLWFVCKLCRESFPDTDKFKSHKLESHLGESLNIKCIVFEEKLLDHEWFPPSHEFSSKQDQLLDIPVKTVTAQESNPAPTPAVKQHRGDLSSKLTFAHNRNFGSAKNGKLLTKRKRSSDVESCLFPPKQLKTEESNSDDVHTTKIRELLSNAVVIKSETNPDQDDPVFLEPQDFPISIVPEPEPEPECPMMEQEVTYSYPVILNINGKLVQVEGEVESDNLNLFDASFPAGPGPNTAASAFTEKVEFVEYDDSDANQHDEIGSTEPETETGQQGQILYESRDLPLVSEEPWNSGSGSSVYDQMLNSVKCQICNASFKGRYYLAQHMHRHSKERAFQCPHCDSAYKSRSNLRVHLIARHGRETAFKCRFCGKSFAGQATLTTHESTHKGFKYYKCDSPGCEAEEFWSESTLKIHMRTQHATELGIEEFSCLTCGKRFCSKSSLCKHQKSKHKNVVMEILP